MRSIFKAIVGSQAYGTATPKSDIDYKGVYIQDSSDVLGLKYKPQIEHNKDHTEYELRRFVELLRSANPTMLEMLYSPIDCVQHMSPCFGEILAYAQLFLTKRCKHSFGGYAVAQIKKAKGLNKKQNWEAEEMVRKTPLDFCYISNPDNIIDVVPLTSVYTEYDLKRAGLAKIPHARDQYALYLDPVKLFKFRGIIEENSNDVRLSSIPKEWYAEYETYSNLHRITFNKDAYQVHCRKYKEYQDWLENRNTQRYVDFNSHGQQYDGKNLLHLRRLLNMALEIGEGKGLIVRRPEHKELLKIRRGEVDLEEIINTAEEDLERLNEIYDKSDLPDEVDADFCHELIINVRDLCDAEDK